MIIKILNYNNETKNIDIGPIENILRIDVNVISGDEVLDIIYTNGAKWSVDEEDRYEDYHDGHYPVYIRGTLNLLEDPAFINRKSSYEIMRIHIEESPFVPVVVN